MVIELLYFEHHPALFEMGVDQVTLKEGQKLISSFLPLLRSSGGLEDGKQVNLAGTVLPHK